MQTTTVHAEIVGSAAVLPRRELEKLVELARRSEHVELELREYEVPPAGIARLAEIAGAFAWLAEEPDRYSAADLKVRYR